MLKTERNFILYQKSKKMNILKTFRYIALAEGISFIILIFIAVPLKYLANIPEPVKLFGMMHGVLFVLFIVFCTLYSIQEKKKLVWFAWAVLLSFLPFGTFYLDMKLR